jgi:hypothetical protein
MLLVVRRDIGNEKNCFTLFPSKTEIERRSKFGNSFEKVLAARHPIDAWKNTACCVYRSNFLMMKNICSEHVEDILDFKLLPCFECGTISFG